jgi:CspA family cold shock protein
MQGTVKWFDGEKGFGFLTPDDGGEDAFVRFSDIRLPSFETLNEDQRVEFEVVLVQGRRLAKNVVPL